MKDIKRAVLSLSLSHRRRWILYVSHPVGIGKGSNIWWLMDAVEEVTIIAPLPHYFSQHVLHRTSEDAHILAKQGASLSKITFGNICPLPREQVFLLA